jgi:polysaccharide pyruvyl transferase WcaK-like protein
VSSHLPISAASAADIASVRSLFGFPSRRLQPSPDLVSPRLRRVARFARTYATSRRRVAYLGWLNHENMGDEAMLVAHRRALAGCDLVEIPERVQRLTGPARRLAAVDGIVLGGGTLIGRTSYRESLERLSVAAPSAPAVMLGTGVEEPEFTGRKNEHDELQRWAEVLARFASVDVRGPRSQRLLSDLGIESRVVGDSALLLGDTTLRPAPEERVIGINLSLGMDIWGDRPSDVFEAVAGALRELMARGWRPRFVPLWPPDIESARMLERALGRELEIVEGFRDLSTLLHAIGGCRIFLGQKLHSVVLAAAVHVPAISLEYHPKCRDFQCSLGRERWTIRTDRVTAGAITDLVDEADAAHDEERRALYDAVRELRGRLDESAARARRTLAAAQAR